MSKQTIVLSEKDVVYEVTHHGQFSDDSSVAMKCADHEFVLPGVRKVETIVEVGQPRILRIEIVAPFTIKEEKD